MDDQTILNAGRVEAIVVATAAVAARLYPGRTARARHPGDAVHTDFAPPERQPQEPTYTETEVRALLSDAGVRGSELEDALSVRRR